MFCQSRLLPQYQSGIFGTLSGNRERTAVDRSYDYSAFRSRSTGCNRQLAEKEPGALRHYYGKASWIVIHFTREGMTHNESYPPCFGTIYFPTAPLYVLICLSYCYTAIARSYTILRLITPISSSSLTIRYTVAIPIPLSTLEAR